MSSQVEIAAISRRLHDEYFYIDRLEYDADRRELRLPIFRGEWKKRWLGWTSQGPEASSPPFCVLVVKGVEEVLVNDDAETGLYNIGGVESDEESQELRIRSHIPCEIIARCTRLDVECLDG